MSRSLPLQGQPALPPPFLLTGAHFAASLVWLALGAAGLIVVAPTLASGGFLDPRVFAVTHSFTLGMITTAIFGALYQLFPALLGVTLKSVGLGFASFWLLTLGTGSLVAGFWFSRAGLLATGAVALAAALGGFSWNLLPQRRKARQGRLVGLYVAGGHAALGTALLVGGARVGARLGWWQLDQLRMIAAHFHLAAIGFGTLTAIGVGSRILPMFLLSSERREWALRYIGPLGGAGLLIFSTGQALTATGVTLAGAILVLLAGGWYLWVGAGYFRNRGTVLDPALGHVAAAYLGFAATLVGGVVLLLTPHAWWPRTWAAYGTMALLGWMVLLILGVYYRIVPFLAWLNAGGRGPTTHGIPDATGLMRRDAAWWSLGALVTGVWGSVAGIVAGSPGLARAGAIGFAGGVALLLAGYLRMVRLLRRASPGARPAQARASSASSAASQAP